MQIHAWSPMQYTVLFGSGENPLLGKHIHKCQPELKSFRCVKLLQTKKKLNLVY